MFKGCLNRFFKKSQYADCIAFQQTQNCGIEAKVRENYIKQNVKKYV